MRVVDTMNSGSDACFRYDELGFRCVVQPHSSQSFDETFDAIEKLSDEQYIKAKSIENNLTLSMDWERFLANVDVTSVEKSAELKQLVRRGVPPAHRSKVWKR